MSETDGGPAFPEPFVQTKDSDGYTGYVSAAEAGFGGMTLRDYFAAQAVQRLSLDTLDRIAAPDEPCHDEVADGPPYAYVVPPAEVARRVAVGAYLIADAMLRAREVK